MKSTEALQQKIKCRECECETFQAFKLTNGVVAFRCKACRVIMDIIKNGKSVTIKQALEAATNYIEFIGKNFKEIHHLAANKKKPLKLISKALEKI